MRTYGRISDGNGGYVRVNGFIWQEVSTDANGSNDLVMLTTLCQVLKGLLGESPFYGNFGIPSRQSIMQQVAPDYYMGITQQQFSPFFASLTIGRVAGTGTPVSPTPAYSVSVITHAGVALTKQVAT